MFQWLSVPLIKHSTQKQLGVGGFTSYSRLYPFTDGSKVRSSKGNLKQKNMKEHCLLSHLIAHI